MLQLPISQLKIKKTVTAAALTLALLTSLTGVVASQFSPVYAQEVRAMTAIPPTISVDIEPGSFTEGTLKLVNDSSEPLTFRAIMQDFIVDNTQGIPNILPPDTLSNKYSAASWIGLDAQEITVAPGVRQELRYYIQVPPDARPGGHYAVVVFDPRTTLVNDRTSGSLINSQLGTLFLVNVKGPITERGEVSAFKTDGFSEYGPITVNTQIKNLGDLHITPKGFITVSNMFGKQSYTVPLEERNVFPGAARDYENSFGKKLMLGRYKATLTATFGQNNNLPLTSTVYFWVFPWKVAIVVILIIVAAILGGLYLKKKRTNIPPPQETQQIS